jgi:SNF2 family DNA or RNA helicase
VRYGDGTVERLKFASVEEVAELGEEAKRSWRNGISDVQFRGASILVDASFVHALDELKARLSRPKSSGPSSSADRRFLLIHRNFEELEYEETTGEDVSNDGLALPNSLNAELKAYQREGVGWLQRSYLSKKRGCLLADDMGLGKTLQILSFLAWLIEEGRISPSGVPSEVGPYNPILIVAPVILLENETWISDAKRFFKSAGAIFTPWETLHGSTLKRFRKSGSSGQETRTGEPSLDLEKLRSYRLLLTNYETVTNYQHSFARMKDHWSVVVTDEAQEHKTPDSKISHALKSLAPGFRIASTGTPVETKLLDVWNLCDFLNPGLLGSAKRFDEQFELRREMHDGEQQKRLSDLKVKLRLGQPSAFILRREKSSHLKELPPKYEHKLLSSLTPEQRQWHVDLVRSVRSKEDGVHAFAVLAQLTRLYEHISLVPQFDPKPAATAIESSPKLRTVIECLERIRSRGEKALIFNRSLNMQEVLHSALQYYFGLDVDIINGVTPRNGSTERAKRDRKTLIDNFRSSVGFNVLILSPEAAGTGLTLIEANHVIHMDDGGIRHVNHRLRIESTA